MRRLLLPFAAVLLLTACGAEQRAAGPDPRVTIRLSVPSEGQKVRADKIEVRGSVSPRGATVLVAGQPAGVDGGSFAAVVDLDPGANVIDVTAGAAGRRADVLAVRVVRDMSVEVPALVGVEHEDAAGQLTALGLEVEEERGGTFLDRIIPGTLQVCESRPPEGTLVQPHATVTLVVARVC